MIPVIEGLMAWSTPHPPADLDRHVQGGGRRGGARRGGELGQRRERVQGRPGDGRAGGGQRRRVLSDAHARRAAHDAARWAALWGRGRRGEGVPGGAVEVRGGGGCARGSDHARPGHRVRQDGRAQPRAAAPSGRAGRTGPPARDRHLAQELLGSYRRRGRRPGGAAGGRAQAAGHDRLERAGAGAWRERVQGARRRAGA